MKKLSREQKRDISTLAVMKDSEIDLTEVPEVLDWGGAEIGKFYRGKKKVALRQQKGQRKSRPQKR